MNDKQADAIMKAKEINLKAILTTLMRRMWLIVLITILFTVLASFYNSKPEDPIYSSTSRILIGASSSDSRTTANVLIREPIVLSKVIEELGLRQTPEGLRTQIRVSNVDGSLVTLVTVIDTNPQQAADIANTVVEAYKPIAAQILGITAIRTLTEAEPGSYPINEKSNSIVIVAFLAGLFIGVCAVYFLESWDDSIRTERDVQALLGVQTLGQVGKMRRRSVPVFPKKKANVIVRGESIGS